MFVMDINLRKVNVGTNKDETMQVSGGYQFYFGLQGDDELNTTFSPNMSSEGVYLVGGTGSDSYSWIGYGGVIIIEAGGSNDTYDGGFSISDYYAEIGGKHLIMIDESYNFVLFANYKDPLSKIENFNVRVNYESWDPKQYTYEQFISAIKKDSGWLGSMSYDQVGLSIDGQKDFESMLNSVAELSNKYEVAANPSDTIIFSGKFSDYSIRKSISGYEISNSDGGFNPLNDISKLKFVDYTVSFNTEGIPGQVYRLYKAAFDRNPDMKGLGFWIDGLENGASISDAAGGFIASDEFKNLYGEDLTNEGFLTALYNNVLDRDPDPSGLGWWLAEMDSGRSTRPGVLQGFSESSENQENTIGLIASGIVYEEWLG